MARDRYNLPEFLDWFKETMNLWHLDRLKSLFFKNLGKKILAVVFALALWFSANMEQDVEKSVSIDVEYMNLPPDLVIMNEPPQTLNLRVRGPRTQLSSLSPRNMVFTLDLTNATPGVSKFEINTDQINPPKGIQVIGVSPAEIKIDIDKVIEREVEVKTVIDLPDTGYEVVGEPKVVPSEVKIRGPKNIVSQIKSISTDLVSTTGVKSSFTIEVPLRTYPRVDILGGGFARVSVNIKERIVTKEFKGLNINIINFDGVKFKPSGELKAELVFEGPYSIIKDLNSNDIKVFVDANKLKQNSKQKIQRLKVNVDYPYKESLILTKQAPEEIEVILEKFGE
jgi:YbbR domain-containing protein